MSRVVLVKKSYEEARKNGEVPDLDLVGMVSAAIDNRMSSFFCAESLDFVSRQLKEKAEAMGAAYIFDVDYKVLGSKDTLGLVVSGDAFRFRYEVHKKEFNKNCQKE